MGQIKDELQDSKLIIEINDQLKKKFRLKTLMNDTSMTELVIQWVDKYVGNFNPNL